jgi:hypothetical protein
VIGWGGGGLADLQNGCQQIGTADHNEHVVRPQPSSAMNNAYALAVRGTGVRLRATLSQAAVLSAVWDQHASKHPLLEFSMFSSCTSAVHCLQQSRLWQACLRSYSLILIGPHLNYFNRLLRTITVFHNTNRSAALAELPLAVPQPPHAHPCCSAIPSDTAATLLLLLLLLL